MVGGMVGETPYNGRGNGRGILETSKNYVSLIPSLYIL